MARLFILFIVQPITLIIVGFYWVFQVPDLLLVYEMRMSGLSSHNSLSMRWSSASVYSICMYYFLVTSLSAYHIMSYSCRYVSSELATDVIINVGEVKFYLHKVWSPCYFPIK